MELKYDKNSILKKIPMFFSDSNGKPLHNAKTFFKENHTSIEEIKKKFDKLENIQDYSFWKELLSYLEKCFLNQPFDKKKILEKLETNFEEFYKEIFIVYFDELFNARDEMTINDEGLDYESNLFSNSLIFDDGNVKKIFWSLEAIKKANVGRFYPGNNVTYPTILMRIDTKTNMVELDGTRGNINKFIELANNNSKILDFDKENFSSFDVNVRDLVNNLELKGFTLNGLSYNSSDLFLHITSKDNLLGISSFINPEFILSSKLDFINIKRINLLFDSDTENSIHLNVDRFKDFFKINVNFDKRFIEKNKEKTLEKLETLKIIHGASYDLPIEFFLDKLVNSSLKGKYRIQILNKKNDSVIKDLISEKILSDSEFKLDEFIKKLVKKLRNLKNKKHVKNNEFFEIIKINKEGNRINIDVKYGNDNLGINRRYKLVIPVNTRFFEYEKILYVILSDVDYYLILKSNEKDLIRYLFTKFKYYKEYKHNITFLKSVNKAYKTLSKFTEEEIKKDKKEQGNVVERQINILFKFLFRNFIPLGGSLKPDGYLSLNNNNYLLDSKQHSTLKIGEFDKMKRYLNDYPKKHDLPEIYGGVLIVTERRLKSLNSSILSEWFSKEKILFLTVDFLVDLYSKYCDFVNEIEIPENKEKFFKIIEDILLSQNNISSLKDLRRLENDRLNGFLKMFDRNSKKYIPQEERQL